MSSAPSDLGDLVKISCRREQDGALLWVELDSPPGNVLDAEMTSSIRRVVKAAAGWKELRLLAFAGAGKHFSFGASVEEHRPEKVGGMLEGFHGLFRDLMETDVPTLALMRGQCLGGGLELASFCDRIVAEEGAKMGQPEIRLGVFAPMASLLLPWRCGARASELLLTGKVIDTETAAAWGLVDQVVASGEGEGAVTGWLAEALMPLSASSVRYARRASRWWLHRSLGQGIEELEQLYLDDLMNTHDAVEGIQSFLEKRQPTWTHG